MQENNFVSHLHRYLDPSTDGPGDEKNYPYTFLPYPFYLYTSTPLHLCTFTPLNLVFKPLFLFENTPFFLKLHG